MKFETILHDLDNIVRTLEQGDLSLEDALSQFEKGVNLVRSSQETLAQAQQRIQMLIEKEGKISACDLNLNVEGETNE